MFKDTLHRGMARFCSQVDRGWREGGWGETGGIKYDAIVQNQFGVVVF